MNTKSQSMLNHAQKLQTVADTAKDAPSPTDKNNAMTDVLDKLLIRPVAQALHAC